MAKETGKNIKTLETQLYRSKITKGFMEGGVYVKPTLFNKEGHLTDDTVKLLKRGTLKDEELISILEHISDCQKCASVFADSFEDDELAEAPLGFEEKVQIEIKIRKSNIHFSLYCVRVAVAASIALIMVFQMD